MTVSEAIIALNMLPKVGPVRVRRLLDRFGDAEAILHATKQALLQINGIGNETAEILHNWRDIVDPHAEIEEAKDRQIHIITDNDPNYPKALHQIYDRPLALYIWGELMAKDKHAIGIVGSRRTTHYGTQATKKLSYQLAHSGFTIISGLARGIDTAAHEAAIAANGRTIAVIGSGLAKLYPPENMPLAEKIANGHGAVVSEFSLNTAPDKQTFPMRNRIVAGWSNAILVTECPAWSGSLITANLASEYGKPLFAVPGPIDKPSSAGCNQLIRDGATLVTDATHLMDDMGELPLLYSSSQTTSPPEQPSSPPLPENEAQVLGAISTDEISVDRLIQTCNIPANQLSQILTKLELKRLIKVLPGFRYVRN